MLHQHESKKMRRHCWAPLVVLVSCCWFYLPVADALPLLGGGEKQEEDPDLPPRKKLTKAEEGNFVKTFENGMSYFKARSYDLARVCFQQCVNIEPRELLPHLRLAACLAATGQKEPAMMELFQVLRLDSGCLDARFDLGTLLMEVQKWDEAGGQFLQVLEKQPENAEARGNLAVCLQQEQQIEAAIVQYKYILEKDPKNIKALLNLGAAYETKQLWDDAAGNYKQIVQLDTKHDMAFVGLARCLTAKGDYPAALVLYKHALEINPRNYFIFLGIGGIYEKQNKKKDAIDAATRAIHLNPKDPQCQQLMKKLLENNEGRRFGGSLRSTQ